MSKWIKRFFGLIVLFLGFNIAVSVWVLWRDLKMHFPNLDFSQARFGVASWYSKTDKNINEFTASGERFNDKKLTCASWDYNFGEKLLVIHNLTGKWVVCRVNDRGPNKRLNREIDLTRTAFRRIANPKWGLIYVTIVPLGTKK